MYDENHENEPDSSQEQPTLDDLLKGMHMQEAAAEPQATEAAEGTHRSGFVAIVGKPNVGKSTLLNQLLETKLSIVTPRAQTTRHAIRGIRSGADYQLVFLDTPGVMTPKYKLHHAMMSAVKRALDDADVIILLVDPAEKHPEEDLQRLLQRATIPILLAVNKMDKANEEQVRATIERWQAAIPTLTDAVALSALHGFNTEGVLERLLPLLPAGPAYYDKAQLTDQPERFFATELIREQVFLHTRQELPYSTQVTILQWEEKPDQHLTVIHAEVHVERKNQKPILIGKQGQMLKRIATAARKQVEELLDNRVYLELHIRVTENWKDDARRLAQFGYEE